MARKVVVILSFLCIVTLGRIAVAGDASDSTAAGFLRGMSERALAFLSVNDKADDQTRELALRAMFSDTVDWERIAHFACGRYWDKMTDEQRARYRTLFQDYMFALNAGQMGMVRLLEVQIVSSRPLNEKDTLVDTRLKPASGEPVDVAWRIRQDGDRFTINDVIVEGISVAQTQRDTFASVINQRGVDGLLDLLAAKVTELKGQTRSM